MSFSVMTSEITWEHFRDSARVDRIAWDILLVVKMNGLAAYHMQQSVEKYLKAVIMKYELLDSSPKKLGHMPFDKILKEIEKRAIKNRGSIPIQDIKDIFKPLSNFLCNLTDEKRCLLWKQSLGLEPTEYEIKKFLGPAYFEYEKFEKTHTTGFMKGLIAYYENRDFKSDYTSNLKHNAWLWISNSLVALMFVFPHMEIGRYPRMIDGLLSTDVYREYSRILHLAVMVDLFCKEAEEILIKST